MKLKIGKDIYNFGKKIWSYNRSITGKGTLKTLQEVKKLLPELKIKKLNQELKLLIGLSLMNGMLRMHILLIHKEKNMLN